MKKILTLLLVFAVSSGFLHAQWESKSVLYLTKTFSASEVSKVEAQTSGGSVDVIGGSDKPRIEVYISKNSKKEDYTEAELRKHFEEYYDLRVDVSGSKLEVVSKSKERNFDWKKAVNVGYKIFVGTEVSTDLKTSGGSISLEKLKGNQNFFTSGGSLNVSEIKGNLTGKTSGGSITIENCKSDAALTTSGGSISATSCKGRMSLKTSGGALRLTDLDGEFETSTSGGSIKGSGIKGSLSAFTSGGSVDLSDLACSLSAGTSGGSVRAAFTKVGEFITLKNSGGSIVVEMPGSKGFDLDLTGTSVSTGNLENFSGNINETSVKGKLNGGGVPVNVIAGSGRVKLTLTK